MRVEHEIHQRRKGRNVGVGLLLFAFMALIFTLTFVKVTRGDFELPKNPSAAGEVSQ